MGRRANIKWRLRELHFTQKKQRQIWAATVIQANWRACPVFVKAMERNNRAAFCLQRHWKKHMVRRHARRELARRRDLREREKSACLVQRRYRGVLARKKMRQYHQELATLQRDNWGAGTIQRCERGRVGRLCVNQMRAKAMLAAETTGTVQGQNFRRRGSCCNCWLTFVVQGKQDGMRTQGRQVTSFTSQSERTDDGSIPSRRLPSRKTSMRC
jgi:hypothetical protein